MIETNLDLLLKQVTNIKISMSSRMNMQNYNQIAFKPLIID